jgi:hypothetical protein
MIHFYLKTFWVILNKSHPKVENMKVEMQLTGQEKK